MTYDVEHLFHILTCYLYIFFGEVDVKVFCPFFFFNGVTHTKYQLQQLAHRKLDVLFCFVFNVFILFIVTIPKVT